MDSKGEEQPSDDGEDDAEDNVTIRKKTAKRGKHNEKVSTDGKKLKEKKRILPTMRARESTPNKNKKITRELTVPASGQPVDMDTQQHEHSLANLIANYIETTQTDMALATIKQNFDQQFSSFEQHKVYVQLMLLNFLEICAKIYEGNQNDTELLAKAMSVGIEAMRMAKEGNSSTMPTDLVEQVESTLNLIWLANLDLINGHPLHGKRKELAQRVREMLKEKSPNWEMAAGQSAGKENA